MRDGLSWVRWVSWSIGVHAKGGYAPRTIRRIEKPPRSGKKCGGSIKRPSHQSASVPFERCKVRDAYPADPGVSRLMQPKVPDEP